MFLGAGSKINNSEMNKREHSKFFLLLPASFHSHKFTFRVRRRQGGKRAYEA